MPDLNDIPDCEGGQKIIFSRIPGGDGEKDLKSLACRRTGLHLSNPLLSLFLNPSCHCLEK